MKKVKISLVVGLILSMVLGILYNMGVFSFQRWQQESTPSTYPTTSWLSATPEEEGVDSNDLIEGYQSIIDNQDNVHSMLLIRNGKIVDETYFYPYKREDRVNIHSCTKSIMSSLIGIAIEEGYIKSVDQKVMEFFTDKTIKNLTPSKQNITIKHLLTMSSGLAVNHPDDAMKSSEDWVQYILDLEMSEEPGTKFNYSDANIQLLSAVLQKATSMSAYDYVDKHLFTPMGIKALWRTDPQGIYMGFGEINMTPRDMAKFGYLYLNEGVWEGKQLVPKEWVKESTKKQVKSDGEDDYGYLWWVPKVGFQARGIGEQYIIVVPLLNVVAVSTNGFNHDQSFDGGRFGKPIKLKKLLPNPDALNRLKMIKDQLQTESIAKLPLLKPGSIPKVSNKTYFFKKDNPLNIKEISFDFTQDEEVVISGLAYDESLFEIHIPVDGSFVKDTTRERGFDTVFLKGYWQDDKTFTLVIEKSFREQMFFTFGDDTITIRSESRGEIAFDNLIGTQEQ